MKKDTQENWYWFGPYIDPEAADNKSGDDVKARDEYFRRRAEEMRKEMQEAVELIRRQFAANRERVYCETPARREPFPWDMLIVMGFMLAYTAIVALVEILK